MAHALTDMEREALQSAFQSAADIQRLIMLACIKGELSKDRQNDIIARAERLAEQARRIT